MQDGERTSVVRGALQRIGSFLVTLALTFLGLTAVTFLISRLTKIDPVLAIVGDKASNEVYQRTFVALGLDQPVIVQYGAYLKRLLSGDFGVSVLTAQPVLSDLVRVFPATFELATIATIIGVLVGVPAGVIAGARAKDAGRITWFVSSGCLATRCLSSGWASSDSLSSTANWAGSPAPDALIFSTRIL